MVETSKLAIAGLISTTLRRKINRVIDVEWMLNNAEYAKEVIRISRQLQMEELTHYADRMEELVLGKLPETRVVTPEPKSSRDSVPRSMPESDTGLDNQYIGALR